MKEEQPRLLIIAGPNGAGKTTFAREFLPQEAHCPDFLNADLIAAGLSPFDPDAAAMMAGRLFLREMAKRISAAESFAFETTLSGLSYARQNPGWRAAGYVVSLYFLARFRRAGHSQGRRPGRSGRSQRFSCRDSASFRFRSCKL